MCTFKAFKKIATLVLLAFGFAISGPGAGQQSVAKGPVYFPQMSVDDIRSLPQSVAPQFRNPLAYRTAPANQGGHLYAPFNNCVSFALNRWQDPSLSGGYAIADELKLRGGDLPTCNVIYGLLQDNPNIRASFPEANSNQCPAGSWLVVPMFKGRDVHMVRQLDFDGGRFAQLAGPDNTLNWYDSVPTWIKRGADFVRKVDDLAPFASGYQLCSAMCISTNPVTASNMAKPALDSQSVLGVYGGPNCRPYDRLEFRPNGMVVITAFGLEQPASYKRDGDLIAVTPTSSFSGGLVLRIRDGALIGSLPTGQIVCTPQ